MAFRAISDDLNSDIYVLDRASGALERVTHDQEPDLFANWAADGTLTFVANRNSESRIWRAAIDGRTSEPLSSAGMSYHDWTPDGTRAYAIGVGARDGNIWELSATGNERLATRLAGGRRGSLGSEALATDGSFVYFTWEDDLGDIWVMDVSRHAWQ